MDIKRDREGRAEVIAMLNWANMHCHLRIGDEMKRFMPHIVRHTGPCVVMPNPKVDWRADQYGGSPHHIMTMSDVNRYQAMVLAEADRANACSDFKPLMMASLTDLTTVQDIQLLKGHVLGLKLYPAAVTTNSGGGPLGLSNALSETARDCYTMMEEMNIPLSIHPAVPGKDVDEFDREPKFIEVVEAIRKGHPGLRMVIEHISTKLMCDWVASQDQRMVAGTVTPQHLMKNRNHVIGCGCIQAENYCMPILQREDPDRIGLVEFVTAGHPNVFAGDDSAPHPWEERKAVRRGSPGVAHTAKGSLCNYAEVFEAAGALNRLEKFASMNGPDWYRVKCPVGTIRLVKKNWTMPERICEGTVIPFRAGETMTWQLES